MPAGVTRLSCLTGRGVVLLANGLVSISLRLRGLVSGPLLAGVRSDGDAGSLEVTGRVRIRKMADGNGRLVARFISVLYCGSGRRTPTACRLTPR